MGVPSNSKSSHRHDQVLKPLPTWGSPAAAKAQQLSSEVPLAEAWRSTVRHNATDGSGVNEVIGNKAIMGHYHLVILGNMYSNMPKYYQIW